MTSTVSSSSATRAQVRRAAWRDASAAASRSDVAIRQLRTSAELQECVDLFDTIWRPHDGSSIMPIEILRALSSSASYVVGAYAGDRLVGGCAGFWCPPPSRALYSHIAGVALDARARHLGFALKLHQRAWALSNDLDTITWTFDPLVRRNAHFNVGKLGGTVRTYYVNHYGAMLDDINGGDDSDRLLLEWELASPRAVACAALADPVPVATGLPAALVADTNGLPVAVDVNSPEVLVAVPADIETMRQRRPEVAAAWRLAVRDTLSHLLAAGGQVHAFDRNAGYVVTTGEITA